MTEPFLGEIRIFGFSFPPRSYMAAQGQLLPIAQYTALFSILGITYGGDGQRTFALPNFGGTAPMQQGSGPGLTPYALGETVGVSNVTLLTPEMPAHIHGLVSAVSNPPLPAQQIGTPGNTAFLSTSGPGFAYTTSPQNTQLMSPLAVGLTGGGEAHSNQQPYLALNFCIAVQGAFPIRS